MAKNKIPVTFLQCKENSLPENKVPGRWIIVTDKQKIYLDIDSTTRVAFDNEFDGNGKKTDSDTVPVHIDEDGQLWVSPYVLNSFEEDKLGGLMGVHSAEQILSTTQDLEGLDYRQFYVGKAYKNYPEEDKSGRAAVLIPFASANIPGLVSGPKKTSNETQQVHISESGAMFVPKIPDYFNNFTKALSGGTLNLTLNKENGNINIEHKDSTTLENIVNSLELGVLVKFTFKGIGIESEEFYNCIKDNKSSWTLVHIGAKENFIPQTITLIQQDEDISLSFGGRPLLISLADTILTPPYNGAEGIVYNATKNWAYDIKTLKIIYTDGALNTDNAKKVTFSQTEDNSHLMVGLPEN